MEKNTQIFPPIKAEIKWAFLHKPNEKAGNKYTVDLCNLSDRAVEALQKRGVKVNHKEGSGNFITCKSKHPIRAYDDGGAEIDADVKVGNGSKGICTLDFYEWTYLGKKGWSASVKKLVITDLIEYKSAADREEFAIDLDEAL